MTKMLLEVIRYCLICEKPGHLELGEMEIGLFDWYSGVQWKHKECHSKDIMELQS
jgi:hypothetical protein